MRDDPQEGPNKFMLLCDSVHSSLALLNIALAEVIITLIACSVLILLYYHDIKYLD